MSLIQTLNISQIIISVLLVVAILLQQRGGGGLSPVFGGGETGAYRARRGLEKIIFRATIVLSILFLVGAILNFILRSYL